MASLEQYVQLWERVQGFHLQNGVAGRFTWKWYANQQYSSKLAYRAGSSTDSAGVPGANILCKTKALPSSKFFV
jgi:hypothetical protein